MKSKFQTILIIISIISSSLCYFTLNNTNIDNCIKYINQQTCQTCREPLILNKGQCIQSRQKLIIFKNKGIRRMILDEGNIKVVHVHSKKQLDQQKDSALFQFSSQGLHSNAKCAFMLKGICIMCSYGYQMSSNGQCILRFEECLNYGADFMCQKCHPQFMLSFGQCIDNGCQVKSYYHCTACKYGMELTQYKHCQILHCATMTNGECTECELHYQLINGICQISQQMINNSQIQTVNKTTSNQISTNLSQNSCDCLQSSCTSCQKGCISINSTCQQLIHCLNISGNICLVCQLGYSITSMGTCFKTILGCMQYSFTGCLQCADNFMMSGNQVCQLDTTYIDQNCISKDIYGICTICKDQYKLSPQYNSLCQFPSTQCKTITKSGDCLSCNVGYILNFITNSCIKIPSIDSCVVQVQGLCKKCAYRYYPIDNVLCREVDRECMMYNEDNGQCYSCYQGYELVNSKCQMQQILQNIHPSNQSFIPFCNKPDPSNSTKCQTCIQGYYVSSSSGLCTVISPFCKTYNQTNGACFTCYQDYQLKNDSICVAQADSLNQTEISQMVLENCEMIDPITNLCSQCMDRYYKSQGICKQVNEHCNLYDSDNGYCLSCYIGYTIQNGQCIFINNR